MPGAGLPTSRPIACIETAVQEYRTVGDKAAADEAVEGAIALLEKLAPSANLAMAYGWRSLLALNRGWDREALEFGRACARACQTGPVIAQPSRTRSATSAERLLGTK